MTKTTHWKSTKSTSSVKRKTRQLKNRVQQVHRRYCVFQDLPTSRFSPKPRSKQDQEHIFTSIQGQQEKFKQDTKGRPTGPTGSTRFEQVPPVKQDQTRPSKTQPEQTRPTKPTQHQARQGFNQDQQSNKTKQDQQELHQQQANKTIQGSPSCQSRLPVRLRRPVFFSILLFGLLIVVVELFLFVRRKKKKNQSQVKHNKLSQSELFFLCGISPCHLFEVEGRILRSSGAFFGS